MSYLVMGAWLLVLAAAVFCLRTGRKGTGIFLLCVNVFSVLLFLFAVYFLIPPGW